MKNLNENRKTLTDENEALQAELASCKQEITNYQNENAGTAGIAGSV